MWPVQGNLKPRRGHGNPEQGPADLDSRSLVQRLYGHRLNHDGMAKRQSSPQTPEGGGESRSGMKPRVAGSNPAGRTADYPLVGQVSNLSGQVGNLSHKSARSEVAGPT